METNSRRDLLYHLVETSAGRELLRDLGCGHVQHIDDVDELEDREVRAITEKVVQEVLRRYRDR